LSFEIKIPLFEGPFDLLLFFIERSEIDIYDIPIAQITHDFLDYIHQLEEMNLDVAGDFILMAATLMRIKAKMLLPKDEVQEGESEDPRQELVNYLLEYKKYKSVLAFFSDWEAEEFQKEPRGNLWEELNDLTEANQNEMEWYHLDLYKLLRVYEQVMNKVEERKNQPVHRVVPFAYTVSGQKEFLLEKLQQHKKLSFQETIAENPVKIAIIFNFLAILELLQNRLIVLHLDEGFNNFWIESPKSV
jgi:segregation and condensation protein A